MIEAEALSRSFSGRRVVDCVNFYVPKGEVTAFIGPNGAGKTTTMRMLTGYLRPNSGTARIMDIDMRTNPIEAQAHLGYLPEGSPLWPDLNPRAYLTYLARVRNLAGRALHWTVDRAIRTTNLGDVAFEPIGILSKGFQRRVALAACLLHDPEVLILDEPTDGLDPNQKHHIRSLIATMGMEKSVIVSTHILEEVDAVAKRVIVISEGRIVADESPAELRARAHDHGAIHLKLAGGRGDVVKMIRQIKQVAQVQLVHAQPQTEVYVYPKSGQTIADQVGACLADNKISPQVFEVRAGTLDQVFRNLTRGPEESSHVMLQPPRIL